MWLLIIVVADKPLMSINRYDNYSCPKSYLDTVSYWEYTIPKTNTFDCIYPIGTYCDCELSNKSHNGNVKGK